MPTLAHFPLLNQNSDTREINKAWDCVPTCVACGLIYFTGKTFDPGSIKDTVYGASYQGGTDAANYVSYCAAQGVTLYQITGIPSALIAEAHSLLDSGLPSIITIPDPYMPAGSGYTHVDIFCQDSTGALTVLDPYIGQLKTFSDATWESLLVGNMLWVMKGVTHMGVPSGWRDDGSTLFSPSHIQGGPEVPVTGPFRDYVLANAWRPSDRAIETGYHVDQLEYSNPSLGGGFRQQFIYSLLEKPDAGTLAGQVVYAWLGVESNYLRSVFEGAVAHVSQLEQQIAQGQAEIATLTKQLADANDPTAVANRLTALAQLGHQIESVANQPL